VTGSFGYLFNDALHPANNPTSAGSRSWLSQALGTVANALDPNAGILGVGAGGGLGWAGPVLGEFAGLERAAAGALEVGAETFSTYDTTITGPRSILNAQTNVSATEFESNLVSSGYSASASVDGQAIILDNGTNRYVIRSSTNGPTADFYPNGSAQPTLKIRLGQ
jgi:hypothetical protein